MLLINYRAGAGWWESSRVAEVPRSTMPRSRNVTLCVGPAIPATRE